jgi:hypothetical protein
MPDDGISARARAPLPERIGRYRILKRIGRGAMGLVYAAIDEAMGRTVAVKVLMADLESAPDTRARFNREAQAAARLVHPNIITIFDAGEDQGRPYIVMQLLEGWPLAEYLKRQEAATLDAKLDLMVQMCEGLAAAHSQGVIHRDLKPSNLFVQTDGLLKIYDFGVARLAESSLTAAGTMLGTPDYMSPEQARGEHVDARSDIFSAGAVFYFILSERKPFSGRELPTVLHQLQFEDPPSLTSASVPSELSALVLHAMTKNAADRPARIQDVLADIVRFQRQYQAETRRLASTLRARLDAIEKLLQAANEAGSALGMPADEPALRERFPWWSTRGGGVEAVSADRARVTAVLHELETELQRLTADLDRRRVLTEQLETGRGLIASGDARGALRLFELVMTADPSAARARELADVCRPQARAQEAREQRIAELMSAAHQAMKAHDWNLAAVTSEEVLAVSPGYEPAASLLAEAQQATVREQLRQDQMLRHLLDRAAAAIDQRDFETANAALTEAETMRLEAPALAELRRRLAEAQAAAEAEELLRQTSADEICRARAAFRRGRHDEAVQQLSAFLDVEPQAPGVEAELERLVWLRQDLASSAASRRREALKLLTTARSLAGQDLLPEALVCVRDAVHADPVDLDAAALFDDLLERHLKQRIARAKTRALERRVAEAEPILAAAREAFARGYVAIALDVAMVAYRLAPTRTDVAAFVDEMRRSLDAEDDEPFPLADTPLPELAATSTQTVALPLAPELSGEPDAHGWFTRVSRWVAALRQRYWPAKGS